MSEAMMQANAENQEADEKLAARMVLESRVRSGASWFYWIAALSIINSVIALLDGSWNFIFGLGITQVIDAIYLGLAGGASEAPTAAGVVTLLIDIAVVSVFVLFGIFAARGSLAAFWIGGLLYLLDGMIFLLFQDWLPLGFHAFALFSMYGGAQALRNLKAIESDPFAAPSPSV